MVVPVRIENRAQLIYLLTEAAELEHSILCCYLFAAFSLKHDESEGMNPAQRECVERWRGVLREITIQEMLHLATACNLLTAVGGAPQFRRPNLPASPRAYPPAFKLQLVPFSMAAVEQFCFLERPESMAVADAAQYRVTAQPLDTLSDIFSSERQYETVGELYRGIEDGLSYLTQKLGERQLFIGPDEAQTAETFFGPGLIAVHDLASALAAIQMIVEQGEGASIDAQFSHYNRFVRMRDEYREVLAADAHFAPARPVLLNPYATVPNDLARGAEVNVIDDPLSVDVCNLVDGCYELMVQMLGRLFVHGEESEADLAGLADMVIGVMMEVIEPLATALTRLPAGPAHPGRNAGPSFRLSRGASVPAHRDSARGVFRERLTELAAYGRFLQSVPGAPAVLTPVRAALTRFAESFATP